MKKMIFFKLMCLLTMLLFTGCGDKAPVKSNPSVESTPAYNSSSDAAQKLPADASSGNKIPAKPSPSAGSIPEQNSGSNNVQESHTDTPTSGGKAPAQSVPPVQNNSSGTAENPSTNTSGGNTVPETPPDNALGSIYKKSGEELYDFYEAFYDGMMVFYEPICNSYDFEDFEASDEGKDFFDIYKSMYNISKYDDIVLGDNVREEGESGLYHVVREKNGHVITFRASTTWPEDMHIFKKGDICSESGTLNTSTNTLTMEYKFERDGTVISRIISEVCMLKDGSFIGQILKKPIAPSDIGQIPNKRMTPADMGTEGVARFMRITKAEVEVITAYFAPDVNFTYNSIVGKTDATPESMADGYTKVRQFIIKDGKTAATKY